jgi:hypothetical protein
MVLLDNQADVSVMHPFMLEDIQTSNHKLRIKVFGGAQFTVTEKGNLPDFFPFYASKLTKANVISFAKGEDKYPIMYVPRTCFNVHLPDQDIRFHCVDKLYIADWNDNYGTINVMTAEDNEKVYTKHEVNQARVAYKFVPTCAYPSIEEAVRLLENGTL